MPIFKLSAPKTIRRFSDHILSRNASNFTRSHLDFKKFPWGTPGHLLTGAGNGRGDEGIKGFIPLKGGGDRRPWMLRFVNWFFYTNI